MVKLSELFQPKQFYDPIKRPLLINKKMMTQAPKKEMHELESKPWACSGQPSPAFS